MRDNVFAKLWDQEYANRGIPSSQRLRPSSCVLFFFNQMLQLGVNINGKKLLDLGCGRGRNAIYAAGLGCNVTAVDFSKSAVRDLTEKVSAEKKLLIHPVVADLSQEWQFCQDSSIDLVLDIFVSKHITDPAGREIFMRNLLRILKIGALFVVHLAGLNDGYYGNPDLCPAIENSPYQSSRDIKHIKDKAADGIESLLYSEEGVVSFFSKSDGGKKISLIKIEKQADVSPMHGCNYQRELYRAIFQCN